MPGNAVMMSIFTPRESEAELREKPVRFTEVLERDELYGVVREEMN